MITKIMSPLTALYEIGREPRRTGPVVTVAFNPNCAIREKCTQCGRIVTIREGFEGATAESEGKAPKEWTDHIGEFQLVFSERVVDSLKESGITGFVPHPLQITRVESLALASSSRPNYFVIEVTGRVDIDREHYDGGDGLLCEACGVWRPRPGGKVKYGDKMTVPVLESWDGSDFVKCRNIRHGGFYCAPSVVELARVGGWTGFEFRGFVPRLPAVNLTNPDWLAEFEAAARGMYPDFF
jgi:hypothetical protein